MDINKNRLMVIISFGAVLLSVLVPILHMFGIMEPMEGSQSATIHSHPWLAAVSLAVPVVLFTATGILYYYKNNHERLPLLVTLTLSFSSICTVIGGEGMIEYHFSIFMVVAILAYYENIRLLFVMTSIFAVEHLVAFIFPFWTKIIFGVPDYTFSMLMIHVVYLILTSGATTWQILHKKKYTARLQVENEEKQAMIDRMMEKLADTSQSVLQTVKDLSENSDASQQEIQLITSSIQQMAAGADTQLAMAVESGSLLEEMTSGIHQIASSSSIVVEASSQATEEANQGKVIVKQTMDQINTINQSFDHLSKRISNLEKQSVEINEIISVISDISSQTDLLALNAAIEAARAGEEGKGFSVVAEEVRNLAIRSNQSVKKVETLIKDIQKETNEAMVSMERGGKEVSAGIALVNKTEEAFDRILKASQKVHSQIHETSAISEQLAAGSDQVFLSVQKMTEVAKGNAYSSESISLASEKQLGSVESINGIAGYLNTLVNELNTLTVAIHKK